MTRIHQVVGGLFLLFGAFVIYLSLDLHYRTDYGPGPGFFSFWLGILLVVLSGLDILRASRGPRVPLPEGFLPDRGGIRRILFIIGSLVVALFVLPFLGFSLTMFFFCVFLLRTMGERQAWWATVVIALCGSFGTFHLFGLLQVALPRGFLGI
jgi:putative tricarboxylic transport membrane protein